MKCAVMAFIRSKQNYTVCR